MARSISNEFPFSPRWMALCACLATLGTNTLMASGSIPGSVEDAVRYSDIIVLGRVVETEPEGVEAGPMKQLVTRHRFRVETYYKGSGPEEIFLITLGGMRMRQVGDDIHPVYTEAMGAEGVRVDEVILAFLRSGPEGYYFVAADGAKYAVGTNDEGSERTVMLRLRKKKYMRGKALEGFERLAQMEEHAAEAAGGVLRSGTFQTEKILVTDLHSRLQQIISGETLRTP